MGKILRKRRINGGEGWGKLEERKGREGRKYEFEKKKLNEKIEKRGKIERLKRRKRIL